MQHHAFVIEAGAQEGIMCALAWTKRELGMCAEGNPDIVVLSHGLLSVDDARRISELAAGAPIAGEHRVIIIAANRAYHEAQNALLKVFEEPPIGTHLFLIFPMLGGLLPTLRSRVQVLEACVAEQHAPLLESAREFIIATKENRATLIKRLTSGKDDEKKRLLRDEALALVNGIEQAASGNVEKNQGLLSDIAVLRSYFYDRSVPVKMILEHLALVTPKDLV